MGHVAASRKDMDLSSTESLIRSVMTDQKRVENRKILPELTPADEAEARPRTMRAQPDLSPKSHAETTTAPRASFKDRVRTYRPSRKHIVLAVLALVVVLRPWLIPGIVFVTFWVGLIAWLTLGPDRVTDWIGSIWDRISTRNPDLAENLRQKGDAFALRFDAFLDKLPQSWAEKLALPDMSNPVTADADFADQPDPFEKLKTPEVYRG